LLPLKYTQKEYLLMMILLEYLHIMGQLTTLKSLQLTF
jgi:hypothetical protein